MADFLELEVHSIEEGKRRGAEIFGTSEENIDLEVVEEIEKGFLKKSKFYKVKVKKREISEPEEKKEKVISKDLDEELVEEEWNGEYGSYSLSREGIYLTVFSPEVNLANLLEEINSYAIKNVDTIAIHHAISNLGKPFLIAPPQHIFFKKKKNLNIKEPRGGFTSYEFTPEGVYLTLHSVAGEKLDFTKLSTEIKNLNLVDVDLDALKMCIERVGEKFLIAPPQPPEVLKDGEVEIKLSADEMEGYITINPPFGGKPVDMEKLKDSLKKNNIVIGIEEDDLMELLEAGKEYVATLKIYGIKPIPGEDAKIEYLFKTEVEKTGPEILEDGRVDYRSLGIVQSVQKGQPLVQKIPPTLGKPGMTVTGKEVPAVKGKDIPLPQGKGTVISEDGLQLLADIPGRPSIINNRVCVLPVYEVRGDVDFKTGNIDFIGNVIVTGNVTSGFSIKSGGDIEIFGNVDEGVSIEAGGKVVIKGNVYGKGKTNIVAGGDILARFVNSANLKTNGNIKIIEAAMDCTLIAGKKILIEGGKKGLLVGGVARAGEEVRVITAGNLYATETHIEVGINPELREELRKIEDKIAQDQENLEKTQNAIASLKQLQKQLGELPPQKKELLLKLTRVQFQLMGELKTSVERKVQIEESLKQTVAAKVSVADIVYPGVKITIKRATTVIREEMRFVTFYEKDEQVKVGSYR
jgi:uncharacterized protein (DUF342 family)